LRRRFRDGALSVVGRLRLRRVVIDRFVEFGSANANERSRN
jgi:hypothetical protein